MDLTHLIDDAYTWTAKRVAGVRAADLDGPTPCDDWTLRQLMNHLLGSLGLHLDAMSGKQVDLRQFDPDVDRIGADPASEFGLVADRAKRVWAEPGALDRTCQLPFGPAPSSVVIVLNLTETVLHGWDVTRATGENATIPDLLAEPLLQHGRPLVTAAHRARAFAAEVAPGDTPAGRLLAFYGRTP